MTVQPLYLRASGLADQVTSRSREMDPRKLALALVLVVPFALGWLVGTTWRATWAALSWLWAAALVGYAASQKTRPNRTNADGGDG